MWLGDIKGASSLDNHTTSSGSFQHEGAVPLLWTLPGYQSSLPGLYRTRKNLFLLLVSVISLKGHRCRDIAGIFPFLPIPIWKQKSCYPKMWLRVSYWTEYFWTQGITQRCFNRACAWGPRPCSLHQLQTIKNIPINDTVPHFIYIGTWVFWGNDRRTI